MRNFCIRYVPTVFGGMLIGAVIIAAVLFIGRTSVDDLVEANLQIRAKTFASFLVSPAGNIETILTGISRTPGAETMVRRVAQLSDIRSFQIFDQAGKAVLQSRSERYDWLIRDRPGGSTSGDRLSPTVLARSGDWAVSRSSPSGEPSVLKPLVRSGQTIGYVTVIGDKTPLFRSAYQTVLRNASALLLLTLATALGLPLLLYLRRKRKIAEADEHIRFLASHDTLTQLLNRRTMQEECDALLSTVRATRERMAYLFIDIDDIAEINGRYGQKAGDQLLTETAERLRQIARAEGDKLARIGPDDFGLLRRRTGNEVDVHALARQISAAVSQPIDIDGTTITPSVSIGGAMVPRDGRTHSELVKHAEIAHQRHKIEKNRDLVFFAPAMDEVLQRRRETEAQIRAAFANGGFELFYQPIVDGRDQHLLGFEALLRMRNEDGDYVSPADFVPVAETRGYIKELGEFVIREAARQIAMWPQELFVAVNISSMQFADGDLLDIVKSALHDAGIDGSRMEIEVVESLLLDRSDHILRQLQDLKDLGLAIDMDDFGTGYSSLSYLWQFPFEKIKIDQSFMVAVAHGEQSLREIVEAIVSMAHHLKMKVTVEGVETQGQVDFLKGLGCEQLQGFYFGKPVPADQVAGEVLARFKLHAVPVSDPMPTETGGTRMISQA